MRISPSINTPTRVASSFVSPLHHFIFLLPPRRSPDLNSDELRRRRNSTPGRSKPPRPKIAAVGREISRRDSWSRGPFFKFGDLHPRRSIAARYKRRKTCAPYPRPVGGDTAEEVPEKRRKRSKHPARQLLDLRSNSDYRCHSDRQPRTHHKIYEEISGCWSCNSSSAKRFPHLHRHLLLGRINLPSAANTPPEIIPVSSEKVAERILRPRALPKKKLKTKERLRLLPPRRSEPVLATLSCASSSLATTSSELESLRSSYQELEIRLKEAEQQKEHAEKQLAEKNSELIREKGEFVLKRNADSETIKRQQKELNGLRKYMETAEHHWDLLAENILGTYTRNVLS
ncbi:hypothetical protein QYE76_062894 [Lolium multiflorum]|uniref:Uncharacterized protein n=1 Tax=Lolium multiflorum TaxID=4521 RepID=A0AAD8S3W9_LOLMU|nr:hypothetical protein QYE76_062894 [Lolium multiflorum]